MKQFLLVAALVASMLACAQGKQVFSFDSKEVLRIESVLASDEMKGRKIGTQEIDNAAQFIADEFEAAGIKPLQLSFLQKFSVLRPKFIGLKAEMDDVELDAKKVMVITTVPDLKVNEKSGYQLVYLTAADAKDDAAFFNKANGIVQSKLNSVVFVDTSFRKVFPRLTGFKRQLFSSPYSTIFVLGNYQPKEFTIKAEHSFTETKLTNVVGVLPGRSKKNEYVIFSAHYDHIGIGKPVNGDSIYNGANDDAAGTTAVIMLANYFKKTGPHDRSIIFAAFTAEESGGFGAQYFSQQLDPNSIAAMMNIEMIGTESKWGKNSAYITGFEKSSMGSILQNSLKGSGFNFYPDPYPDQQLFYRSDNATLARLGVPAHTISTSKMDVEPNYHKPSDEVKTLNIENMTAIIKAIAESAKTLVNGKETPTRVKKE